MSDWKRMKWLPVGAGVLLILLGLLALIWPIVVMNTLPILMGACVLVLGIAEIAYRMALRAAHEEGGPPLLQGVAALAVGGVLLFNRDVSLVFIGVVLGGWIIVSAMFRLRLVWRNWRSGLPWQSAAADAVLKLILAGFMLLRPFKSMVMWTRLVGVFFLVVGISVIVSALYFDRAFHDMDDF